ncbi:unnamed protein product [Adineta ricciae]|uniref:Uncharacterized protein n=1 Tax=Adineta ricciae TaxID=249248 RepID=A0A815A663_ADIRI|nr:unnamed protein product [Adineta ricciae]CAF1254938.1 unnamed protein product [Adineta ricciae]
MASTSDEQISSDVAYLLQEYNDKKENVTSMTIAYGDKRVIREIPLDQHKTHAHPTVEINAESTDEYYTLILIDADARHQSNSINGPYLHWILANFQDATIVDAHTLCTYQALKVGSNDQHRLIFLIYRSKERISASPIIEQENRRQFPL